MRYREILEACWKGYRKDGMKTMFGKRYPNCVKVKKQSEGVAEGSEYKSRHAHKQEQDKAYNDYRTKHATSSLALMTRAEFAKDQRERAAKKKQGVAEVSRATIDRYVTKASDSYGDADFAARMSKNDPDKRSYHVDQKNTAEKRRQGISRALDRMSKDGVAETEQQLAEKCWDGYSQQGMKKKGDRQVPNCVAMSEQELEEDLKKWFKDKWVRFGPDGKIRGDCARGSSKEGKPKCLPKSKAQSLGKKGRASAASRKRRQDPNPNRSGAAKNVPTKKK